MRFVRARTRAFGDRCVRASPPPRRRISVTADQDHRDDCGRQYTDVAARILGQHIAERTGQSVIIDDRPGASGNIAMEAVAKADPDGYTLGFANTGNVVVNPVLYRHMTFDPMADLVPVGPVGTVRCFLSPIHSCRRPISRTSSLMREPIPTS